MPARLVAQTVVGPAAPSAPVRIVLAGDSTVTDHAGWGSGFAAALAEPAVCVNLAQGGRSSRSYRSEGWWQKCLQAEADYVLIQFGHNDQPGKGPARESAVETDFRQHLRDYVAEARAAGITPILVTSLERRGWDGLRIRPSLTDYALATRTVAQQMQVPLIDLHAVSIAKYEALGPTAVRAWEPMSAKGADHTHLNAEGSAVFGQLVARELARCVPALQAYLAAEVPTSDACPSDTAADTAAGDLRLDETQATLTVSRGGRTVLVYNKVSPPVPAGIDPVYQRSGFLHPVLTPAGRQVTAAFPVDHPHQQGIFSAWVRTTYAQRQVDFWNLAGGSGRVLHQRVICRFSDATSCGFEVDLVHQTVAPPVVDVLRERWKVRVHATDAKLHCFDLESTQQALTELPLVVEQYHYGGLAVRGPVAWVSGKPWQDGAGQDIVQEASTLYSDQAADRESGNHQPSRWVVLSGMLDGRPASITVLGHPKNFRSPQTVRLHPSKPYFCFAPCVSSEFVIDREHPLQQRFRFLVTDDQPAPQWIEQQWQQWTGQ